MHFKCTQCPAEFCSGCGGLFKKVLAYNSCSVLLVYFRIVPNMSHVVQEGFMLIILVTAFPFFVMKVLMTFRNYSLIIMYSLTLNHLKDK